MYKLIRKLIDRSIMCPGNRVTFEIIPFSVLLNCPMGQRKKKKRKKDEQHRARREKNNGKYNKRRKFETVTK